MKLGHRSRLLLMAVGCSLGLAGIGGTVYAGFKQDQNVTINAGATTASGSVGTARNSADNVQFIRCTVQSFAGANAVFCAARNAANVNFSCSANANANNFATAVAGIGVGSRLFIAQSGGVCTQIDVTNGSDWKPAVP